MVTRDEVEAACAWLRGLEAEGGLDGAAVVVLVVGTGGAPTEIRGFGVEGASVGATQGTQGVLSVLEGLARVAAAVARGDAAGGE